MKKFLPTTATYYNLQTNIICEDGLSWLPIGRAPNTSAFTGTFNGNGHTIENVKITTMNYGLIGFFSQTNNATIQNLTISGNYSTTGQGCGGIVGEAVNTTMTICNNKVNINLGSSQSTGGMVGYAKDSEFLNCNNYGNVIGGMYTGGIMGGSDNGGNKFEYCANYGNVTGNGYVGGIVGMAPSTILTSNTNNGVIKSTSDYVGGIVGTCNGTNGSITNCNNTGAIYGTGYYYGSLVGSSSNGNAILGDGNGNTGQVYSNNNLINNPPLVGSDNN